MIWVCTLKQQQTQHWKLHKKKKKTFTFFPPFCRHQKLFSVLCLKEKGSRKKKRYIHDWRNHRRYQDLLRHLGMERVGMILLILLCAFEKSWNFFLFCLFQLFFWSFLEEIFFFSSSLSNWKIFWTAKINNGFQKSRNLSTLPNWFGTERPKLLIF